MAPPNRGVSKAVLPQTRAQALTRSVPPPASTPTPASSITSIVAPHINASPTSNTNTNSISRTAITIPYPCASAGSLESTSNQLLRDPSLSYIAGFDPYISPDQTSISSSDSSSHYFGHSAQPAAIFPDYQSFSSPVSPDQYETSSGSLGNLFQNSQSSLQEASTNMFTDTSSNSPHGTYSSPHSSQEPSYNFADPFSSSSMPATRSPYGTASAGFMYNPTETAPAGAYSAGRSSFSSSDDMETDATANTTTSSGAYLYNFTDMSISGAPSPQAQEDDLDYIPTPSLGKSQSPSPYSKLPAGTSASSKEKEQNKQKLYRNRKSEFTNRMRDELLAMNLLPHSRITHAPEIMSKTADTLRDYRDLLLLIRDHVDGMPENLASVPGAVRKLLNENGQVFNNVKPPPRTVNSHSHPKATDGYKPAANMMHVTPIQPLPFRATPLGRHGTF